mmetsp:Transcript_52188/g.169514  ORF Transcript_52188/g.169514 Transcript_52188/m.169514 type:complete len:642 (+) Transcript_52188:64-1989(+)
MVPAGVATDEVAAKADRLLSAMFWVPSALLCIVCSVGIVNVSDMVTLFWMGTLVNVVLSIVKMSLAQVATHPKALMADALHGLGDTAAEVVTALAYTEAARPPDKEHPWGHGKIESVGAVLVTCILLYIAAHMGWDSVTTTWPMLRDRLWPSSASRLAAATHDAPGAEHGQLVGAGEGRVVRHAAIAVTVASILLKEALFKSTLLVGEHEESNLIVASAWHHRSDSLAAGVCLVSQLGASFGHFYLDPLGGGIVASMLAHSAFGSLFESLNDLVDYNTAADGDSRSRCGREVLSRSIADVQGVRNHTLRTRRMGPYCLVDTTIVVEARISASAASVIAEAVHDRVVGDHRPFVTDVTVHVDPEGSPQSHRLETHSEQSLHLERAISPEDLEAQVREAILSLGDARPDLPRILEVTEIQSYYYMEDVENVVEGSPSTPYVVIKADIRLHSEDDVTIRMASLVARAARARVLEQMPGVVRDIDLDLELSDQVLLPDRSRGGEELDTHSSADSTPQSACPIRSGAGQPSQGTWTDDPCPSAGSSADLYDRLKGSERGNLQRVTLIWERGPESREARVPTVWHDRRTKGAPNPQTSRRRESYMVSKLAASLASIGIGDLGSSSVAFGSPPSLKATEQASTAGLAR